MGWQRRCKTCHLLRKLGNEAAVLCPLVFLFSGNHCIDLARSYSAEWIPRRGMIPPRSVYVVRHPYGAVCNPWLSVKLASPEDEAVYWKLS